MPFHLMGPRHNTQHNLIRIAVFQKVNKVGKSLDYHFHYS